MLRNKTLTALTGALVAGGLAACGGSGSDNGPGTNDVLAEIDVPSTYAFDTQLPDQSGSSVAYPGQVARQVLIDALTEEVSNGLQEKIDNGTFDSGTTEDDVLTELEAFFDGGTDPLGSGGVSIDVPAFPDNTQEQTYADLAGDKNLVGKIAGNDDVTDHADWDDGDFVGAGGAGSPELLVRSWFDEIAANVTTVVDGTSRSVDFGDSGSFTLEIYHTEDGRDLAQLVEKFVRGAVAFSQGTDDYLDDDVDGKGLLTDNTSSDEGDAFTALEHQFDEGFGYLGAARDYADYTDEEIAGRGGRAEWANGYHDSNGDGSIDLDAEFNFGHSTNAAKRDLGSTTGTDFSGNAFQAFLNGRAIINNAVGRELTDAEFSALQAARDEIVENWEKAIAATVVHYINDVLGDMATFGNDSGADAYSYADHAKHFSEMKGFALGLQFNPRSPLHMDNDGDGTTDIEQLHDLIGTTPALPNDGDGEIAAYEQDLRDARALMRTAYGFATEDVEKW